MGQWSTLVTPALGSREGKIQGTLSWLSLSVSPMSQGKSCLKNKIYSSSEMTPEVGPWPLHACVCVCVCICTLLHVHLHTGKHIERIIEKNNIDSSFSLNILLSLSSILYYHLCLIYLTNQVLKYKNMLCA